MADGIDQGEASLGQVGIISQNAVVVIKMMELPTQCEKIVGQSVGRVLVGAYVQDLREEGEALLEVAFFGLGQ